ncbi:hypothetical protein F5B20DRAFT_119647 [Whalleya microplaca]|nr:hypothetical protein F5B20DRAFT_119647 [Whalleya microplaca]
MRDALMINDFHVQVVSKLAQRFIQACVTNSESFCLPLENSLRSRPISHLEEERITRALYRFELFRRLFGWFQHLEDEDIPRLHDSLPYLAIFFSKFAPWENAQLACMNDFLAGEILPVFNDFAEHDVVWGELKANFNAEMDDDPIQFLLTLGLEKILEISSSDSYADRERLLNHDGEPGPREIIPFLRQALDSGLYSLSEIKGAGKTILEAPAFCADGDGGAEQIWRLSLESKVVVFGVYERLTWSYRQWGYALWDSKRLQDLGILERPWKPDAEQMPSTAVENWDKMHASWAARADIYRRGGRGYWAEGDETRIVWTQEHQL